MRYEELTIVGRNAVLEAYRSGKTIDRLFILDGCQDGPIKSITREAKKTRYHYTVCIKRTIKSVGTKSKSSGSCSICRSI